MGHREENLKRCAAPILCVLAMSVLLINCSSTPKNQHGISKIVPSSLRVRRPPGAGADPYAGPGGTDYRASALPNEKLDCENPGWLFKDLDLTSLMTCFAELKQPQDVIYQLRRVAVPVLELDPESDPAPPECLTRLLPTIPVPREIVFKDGEKGSCFSSRLDIEASQTLGVHLPKNRLALKVRVPPAEGIPRDRSEMERLLTGWALTPLWEDQKSENLKAKVFPDHLCIKCLGEKEMKAARQDKQVWPEPRGEAPFAPWVAPSPAPSETP